MQSDKETAIIEALPVEFDASRSSLPTAVDTPANQSLAEQRHLLSNSSITGASMAPIQGNAADYGAMNTSRSVGSHNGSVCGCAEEEIKARINDVSMSEIDSSACESQMGESMRYREHVSQYTRERTQELLNQIKDRVTFFGMSVLVLIPATLIANGIGYLKSEIEDQPLIVQNGCNIGLDKWYIFLTGLACLKLLIEIWRYMFIKVHY